MNIIFCKEITPGMITQTIKQFFAENKISKLTSVTIMNRIMSDAFDLETWEDGENLVKAMTEREKEKFLEEIEVIIINHLRDEVHKRLWG